MPDTFGADVNDRVALVTGAGSGIGRSAALALAADGLCVGVLDLDGERARQVASELPDPGRALPLVADVSAPEQVEAAVAALAGRWGRIDAVFANAGVNGVWAPVEDLTAEEWRRTVDVNLTGAFLTCKHTIPWLRRQGGAVVITSSVQGTRLFSTAGSTAYACAKAAQLALTKKLALELAPDRIRVNAVCPGYIATNIPESTFARDLERIEPRVDYGGRPVPLTGGEAHSPDEVARLVRFLVSDEASAISGTEVWIDGATSLLVG
jgi:NAD(P)-dependent dehydrogenase (short-subunit alcohol dehydrogenase family)